MSLDRLDVAAQLRGKVLIVAGGTGFLGKVWLSMVLHHFPEIGHIYLMVRSRKGRDSETRFWAEIVSSRPFEPLRRARPGPAFEAYIREKVTPIDGDVSREYAGVGDELRDELRGRAHALVNVAGVVDFDPPLDEALSVNAFGMQRLVELCRDLGDIAFLHTSTCYVAGNRNGQIDEVNPLSFPFPRADELDRSLWDPNREIAECVDIVRNVRHRLKDGFRAAVFHDEALVGLKRRGEPLRGTALTEEIKKVQRRFEEKELIAAGLERAKFWGWPNTYTKSIGEQILAASQLRFTIVRPAIIESSMDWPEPGWNEGANTSAPLIYFSVHGLPAVVASADGSLDLIPADYVCGGMTLALAELLEGVAKPVYQLGSSDCNPVTIRRTIELTALYKRRYYQNKSGGNALVNWVQKQYGPVPISISTYETFGPKNLATAANVASNLIKSTGKLLPMLKPVTAPTAASLASAARDTERMGRIADTFLPFTALNCYRFSGKNARAALARVAPEERFKTPWAPESIDWYHYFLDVHVPGLERWVMPDLDAKANKPVRPLRRHDTLLAFLDDIVDRHGHAPALSQVHPEGFLATSFIQLKERALVVAARLRAGGVGPRDRVILAGNNHPDWPIAWFGILMAGAVTVPLDPALSPAQVATIAGTAEPKAAILDQRAREGFASALSCPIFELAGLGFGDVEPAEPAVVQPKDTASILFTSGTTGNPKGVMLSHDNFTSLMASISTLFDLGPNDRVLSVLPLHHTFEFTCGLLMPLGYGTRIVYLDELTGERLVNTLKEARITAIVGVPALWQLVERRILAQVREQGRFVELAFDTGTAFNRMLGKELGLDLGKLLFGSVHDRLGGNIRYLISGGSALPKDTHKFFQGIGLHLAEGYGLTEASPVLAFQKGGPRAQAGVVGKAIPGVELRILNADANGVGEVLARGPNIMLGYFGNREATDAVLDEEAWLHTGDLGRLDHAGRLIMVGRAKDVVVTSSGENVYLDDVENRLSSIAGVKELVLVGIADSRGGERLAMLAVPEDPNHRGEAMEKIRAALRELPASQRPSVIQLVDAPLPRTATRKVRRNEVRRILERIVEAAAPVKGEDAGANTMRRVIAKVAGVPVTNVIGTTRLREDLGYDSLMWVELASALGEQATLSADALSRCETVSQLEEMVAAPSVKASPEVDELPRERVDIPAPLVEPLRQVLAEGQRAFHRYMLDVTVVGRAFIPSNRPTIVIANHCSHLDMGLVKHALGSYASQIITFAAKDYFFEGNKWWVAYWEQLTNLRPMDRHTNFRQNYEATRQVVEDGNVVLIFPEGTRRQDGSMGPFKPLVGKLALDTGVDVLPLHLDGTFDILPRDSMVPRGRKVTVRIGPPVTVADLLRLTSGLRGTEPARRASQIIREAVVALRDGGALDVSRLSADAELAPEQPEPMSTVFAELAGRFLPDAAEAPITWYFTLGEEKWTVSADKAHSEVRAGRPSGSADCVVKTSADMMRRIIRDGYTPEVSEFVSGVIKTNDIPGLLSFSQIFRLGPQGEPAVGLETP